MLIGGLQKFSLLDYPDHLSAIIFTQGCNFRCHFCYNPMLVLPKKLGELKYESSSLQDGKKDYPEYQEDNLFDFLRERVGKLDAVVITGGEPTLHADLPQFIEKIKKLGYKVKLDSNGTNPGMLRELLDLRLLDYLAMDVKSALEKYDLSVGVQPDIASIKDSIAVIMASGLPYEFRTTLVPELHDEKDISSIGEIIRGARAWYLQTFKSDTDLINTTFESARSFSSQEMENFCKIAGKFVNQCGVR
jgi:pyruvate formate lyase activating enzyme